MIPIDKKTARRLLIFNITQNMKNAGISEFLLNKEFIVKFNNGGMCSTSFWLKTDSPSRIMKRLTLALKNRLEQKHKVNALQDIERQLIERHDEIFSLDNNSDHRLSDQDDEYERSYIERVTKLRQHHIKSRFSFNDWQLSVADSYNNLRSDIEKNFPEAWPMLQFCLAVKSILHIDNCTLPFMGVILAIPSSMKTLVIQLFRKYPNSFYSDNFTPNSFESHNASLSEEQLQKIDLLPKLNNRLFLTPELAPIFTANEDDLRKSIGIITRILDGHGLETDSGAQGHRKYGNTFFVWIGAAVEIPYRVWQLLGTLGHKIYFFRPVIPEKTIYDLEKTAKDNKFQEKFTETEDALLDYLIEIDAVPEYGNIRIDKNGIVKVNWAENKAGVQDEAINCIAQVANLLKRLRGTVYISISKVRKRRCTSRRSSENNEDNTNDKDNQEIVIQDSNSFSVDESDYDTDYPTVEDPSRAVVLLRNLALGNAISQGRDYINLDDMPLVINVALSSTTRARSELIRLLFDHNGQLTTSVIVKKSKVSSPFAKKTMRELSALGIVDISAVAGYSNSELMITLREEYSWFKSEQFKELLNRNKNFEEVAGKNSISSEDSISDLSDNHRSQSHAEPNTPPREPEIKYSNNDAYKGSKVIDYTSAYKEYRSNKYRYSLESESKDSSQSVSIDSANECDYKLNSEEKNNGPLSGSDSDQHVTVTQSHEKIENSDNSEMHNLTLTQILQVIKEANGSQISFNAAIESACSRNQLVRAYLGDKLTSRENKKVRKLAEIFHLYRDNIEVVKTRPQIILRWIETTDSNDHDTSAI